MLFPGSKLLGRYEFRDPIKNSNKFWECTFNPATNLYDTKWGRNGFPPQGVKLGLNAYDAEDKINEKMRKGYAQTQVMKVVMEERKGLKEMVKKMNEDKKLSEGVKAASSVKAVKKML